MFDPVDLVVSNPPYIPKNEFHSLMKEVREYEPSLALTDGEEGLIFYRFFAELGKFLINPNGHMILEVGIGDHPKNVKSIFDEYGNYSLEIIKDYNGADRVIVIQNLS